MTKLVVMAALASALGIDPRSALANDQDDHGGERAIPLLRGRSATARFESSKGCVTTVVKVQLDDDRTQTVDGTKEHLKVADLTVEQTFDPRLGAQCERLDPTIQSSHVTLTKNPKLLIDGDLQFARLHGDATLKDSHTGRDRFMKFDLRWKGKGKEQKTVTREEIVDGDQVVIIESEVEIRPAQASGFVKEGRVNYTPRPSRIADTHIQSEELSQTTRPK